jgi:peptide/nickel transport system permease protein
MSGEGELEVTAATGPGDPQVTATAARDHYRARLAYVLRQSFWSRVALGYLVVLVVLCVVAPLFFGDLASDADLTKRFVAPFHPSEGMRYFLGSDAVGRSFAARLLVAARTTLLITVSAVAASAVIGGLIGTIVGYAGGTVDAVAMRTADVMLAFPSLLLALIVLYTVGPGLMALILVLAVSRVAMYTRVARAEALAVRERMFVTAARSLGASPARIVMRQVVPVIRPTIITLATVEFALVILAESALSFLGLGVQEPHVTWGRLIADGRNYLEDAWWVALFPGVAITLTAICVNVLADVVRRVAESD